MKLGAIGGYFQSKPADRRFMNQPFLVVDWTATGVALSTVRIDGAKVSLQNSQFAEFPAGQEPFASPVETGKWLRTVCDNATLPATAVAISVPRRDLSVRLLELPNVTDDELGPLVALQVESRAQLTNQAIAWDFVAHPVNPGDTQRYVLLASIPNSVFNAICEIRQAAGWSNVIMTSGDLSIGLDNLRSPQTDNAWQIHIQANPVKLELSLHRGGLLVSSHATAMPSCSSLEAAAIVKSAINRLMAGRPSVWKNEPESAKVLISGPHAPALADALKHDGIHAAVLSTCERTPRALAVGQALRHATGRLDFLRPRSADRPAAVRRQRRVMMAVAVAGVLLAGMAATYLRQQSLDRELAKLQSECRDMQLFVDRGKAVVDKWAYVSRWKKETLNSASELGEFAALLPDRHRLIVTRLQLENLVDGEERVLRVDGLAQGSMDVLGMNAAILEKSERYDLRPQSIEPAPDGSEFSSQFRIEVLLRDGQTTDRDEDAIDKGVR